MSEAVNDPPPPRLLGRGLDLAALAVTGLEGSGAPSLPMVEGYAIAALLGTGGLGRVWKAVRLADGATVALKIPHHADPSFAERLQAEARSLRSLDHPNILRCLSHGILPDGLPWLALEYVHGAALSLLIPQGGFAWEETLSHFRRIADAVIHAHAHGVLHRDLKPSNILIGHDGSLKVADFGLARSVSDRVVTFSLTLSGHVAGTAEYLAPECYSYAYRPTAAADIYALGVILYELLAGHPPRGAWTPVSRQKQVDVRMDEVLHRALEPDPARRFPGARQMLEEIDRIARTPPRYSGTPRLTRAVRFMDFIWTGLGLFLFLGSLGLLVRIEKYGFGLPVDLIGSETIRIGTYQGIVILLICAAPFGLWQLFRLWRFRKVPLREALPSPFGLKLGTTRTAGFIVLLAQFLFIIAPGVLGSYAWRERCSSWLDPSSAPWIQGLVVSHHPQGRISHDRWAWPEADREYFLRERSGWITDPLSRQFDMTGYWPGFMPRLIVGLTLFAAATLLVTVLSAFARWWRFRKWGHSLALLVFLGFGMHSARATLRVIRMEEARKNADWDYDTWNMEMHARSAVGVRELLLPHEAAPAWQLPPGEMLAQYAGSVTFDDDPPRSGQAVVDWLTTHAFRSRTQNRSAETVGHDFFPSDPKERRFHFHGYYLDCTDPPGRPSTGALTILMLRGNILPKVGAEITEQALRSLPLWSVPRRPLPPVEAAAWVEAFLAALPAETGPAGVDALTRLFYPQLLQITHRSIPIQSTPSQPLIDSLRALCANGSRPILAGPPGPAVPESGGRQRITFNIEDHGQSAPWTVDLIYSESRWQGVRLSFNIGTSR